ncbi:hypothetical protein ACI6Q2_13580 [Chitinophagaceae bacterium LWZ2-11]
MKPPLTDEQKEKFKVQFNAIISKAPLDVQAKWTNEISWVNDIPSFTNNVHQKLKGRLADEYVSLSNKLKGRNI